VIQLPGADLVGRGQRLQDPPRLHPRLETPLHRQLEIEHRRPAPARGEPERHQFGHAPGFLDHVAHQPVDRSRWPVAKAVFAQMRDQPAGHQGGIHAAIVDRRDLHLARHQLVGPAAGRRAEIDRRQPRAQQRAALGVGQQHLEGLVEFQCRARRRAARELQARYPTDKPCRAIRRRMPDQRVGARQHPDGCLRIAGFRRHLVAQPRLQGAQQRRQRLGRLAVRRQHRQVRKPAGSIQRLGDRRDPILYVEIGQLAVDDQQIAREHQIRQSRNRRNRTDAHHRCLCRFDPGNDRARRIPRAQFVDQVRLEANPAEQGERITAARCMHDILDLPRTRRAELAPLIFRTLVPSKLGTTKAEQVGQRSQAVPNDSHRRCWAKLRLCPTYVTARSGAAAGRGGIRIAGSTPPPYANAASIPVVNEAAPARTPAAWVRVRGNRRSK
jgi:hypothetical protein